MPRYLWILAACSVASACGFERGATITSGGGDTDAGTFDAGPEPFDGAPKIEIRINLSGDEWVGIDFPGTWAADTSTACDGFTYQEARDLQNTEDAPLFQSAYYGDFTCSIGEELPAGQYEVTLLLAEITRGSFCFTDQEERVFDIDIEGQRVLSDLDLVEASDGCLASFVNNDSHPVVQIFEVDINDGTLTIDFGGEDNALAQAVQLIQK